MIFSPSDTHTNLSLNVPYLAPEVYTVPFTISDSSSPPRSTFINLPGNDNSVIQQQSHAKVTGHGNRSDQYTSKPVCQLVLALLFKGGSVMLHKTSAGMLQNSLLTLNIQTLDALERSHLFPNTLVGRAQPIIAASTSTLNVTTAQKSYEDQARIKFGSLRQGWDLCEAYFWCSAESRFPKILNN